MPYKALQIKPWEEWGTVVGSPVAGVVGEGCGGWNDLGDLERLTSVGSMRQILAERSGSSRRGSKTPEEANQITRAHSLLCVLSPASAPSLCLTCYRNLSSGSLAGGNVFGRGNIKN